MTNTNPGSCKNIWVNENRGLLYTKSYLSPSWLCNIQTPKINLDSNKTVHFIKNILCLCASEIIDLSLTYSTNLWDSCSLWLVKNRNRWRNARVDQFDCWRHAKNIFRAVENIPFNAEVWLGWTSSGAAPTRPMYRSAWKHRHSAYHPPTTLSCLPVTSPKPRQRNQYHPHWVEELEPSNWTERRARLEFSIDCVNSLPNSPLSND